MNNQIFYFFYNLAHQSQLFDNIIIFFAVYFPYVIVMLAGIFLFFYHKNLREFFATFFSISLAYIISVALKILFHTPRPFLALSDVYNLVPENGYSFPSSHSVFFMALAFSLFFLNKKVGFLFMFFAFLVGLARIVAGIHFPIDILGGFTLGAVVSHLFAYFMKKI